MGHEQPRRDRSGVEVPTLPEDLDAWLAASEARIPDLREGSARTIVWAGADQHRRTPLAVVYLHGFSADRHEIEPVPRGVAGALGANLYYSRLTGHGRDGAALAGANVEDWLSDAEEAMTIGTRLGERVIVMGTSTGGTLALWLGAQRRWKDSLAALVLLSPNLALRSRAARLLVGPWGRFVVRLILGPERCFEPRNEAQSRHWTTCYPSSAILSVTALVRIVRALPLEEVNAPVFMAYSPLDRVVDPSAALAALGRIGSPLKRSLVVEGDEDTQHHVLAGDILSPGTTAPVAREIIEFLEQVP